MPTKIQHNSCPECYQGLKNNSHYCQHCQARHFVENADNWTTGDKTIDAFILQTQKDAKECTEYLEYIDFDGMIGIAKYDISELGEVFIGNWKRGPADVWDEDAEKFVCKRELIRVALISLTTDPHEFLKELQVHYRARKNNGMMMRLFGVTREQITGRFMMVAETNEWDLRHYVSHHFVRLTWNQKLAILHTLASGLINHHQQNNTDSSDYNISNNEFGNNNVIKSHLELRVNELGLGDCKDLMPIIGYYRNDLLPLFAPEILLYGATHTKESEVYTFGMLMWEFVVNRPPFYDIPRDSEFVKQLSTGLLNPKIPSCAPICYTKLMQQCWERDPRLRPTMQNIAQTLSKWRFQNFEKEEFEKAERHRIRELQARGQNPFGAMLNPTKTHPQAIYACRHIKLPSFSSTASINRHRPLFDSTPDSGRKPAEVTVKDESFFVSKSILQFREKFPEVELEPEDEDLNRQYNDLSLEFPPQISVN
ncbi:502_t:CDS:1 [Ambispora leptoticha]|uniref:502_t:CDS:1 n=1 Tax=Ambispora leptoticha TaxID=144679 RepID=A0A9N8ZN44_9GLOM|nr:502_t:CDS:1 [Ambispora leptoticha]